MSAGKSTEILKESSFHRSYYGPDLRKEEKIKERERQKFCPRFNHTTYGKRYVLPNYRQPDYFPQAVADKMFSSAILVPLQTDFRDDVMFAAYANGIKALKYNRPQLWLERELGEAFMRTNLPQDMTPEDIQWRWPGFRVHLPQGILHIDDSSAKGHDLMFLDICLWPMENQETVPQPYANELEALAREYNWRKPKLVHELAPIFEQTALIVSGNLNGVPIGKDMDTIRPGHLEENDYMIYAVIKPFDQAVKFGQIRQIANDNLYSPFKNTSDDNRFCEHMMHLALNILIYLGSMPLEYQITEHELRKPRLEGKHQIPGLYAAKFVGQSQLRPRDGKAHIAGLPTGRHPSEHVRAGHWTRQPYGPKQSLRKLIWILPMWVGAKEDEEERQRGEAVTA